MVKYVDLGHGLIVDEKYVPDTMWKAECAKCETEYNVGIERVYVVATNKEEWYCDACRKFALRRHLINLL